MRAMFLDIYKKEHPVFDFAKWILYFYKLNLIYFLYIAKHKLSVIHNSSPFEYTPYLKGAHR